MHNLKVFQLVQTQCVIIVYVLVGAICRKTGIVNDTTEKSLTSAIINIVLPCTIFNAMLEGLHQVDWKLAGIAVVACLIIHVCSYFLGLLFFKKDPASQRAVCIFGILINNAAFVGLPMVASVYGSSGIFYTTIFMTVSRIFMWSLGLQLFPAASKKNPAVLVLTNPNTIAMLLSLAVHFLLPFNLPRFLLLSVEGIGSTSTVLCMVIIGSLITGLNNEDLWCPTVLRYCVLRLVIIPLLVFVTLSLIRLDQKLVGVLTLLTSAPGPTTGSVLAARYQGDKKLAATLALVSTVFSTITVPVLAMIYVK